MTNIQTESNGKTQVFQEFVFGNKSKFSMKYTGKVGVYEN
jgi:hypothetical protein